MDFSGCPIHPPGGGGWTLDLSESPTDPLGGGGWTLDSQKERIQVEGGGWYKVTLVSRLRRWLAGGRRRRRSTPPPAARPVDTAKTTKKVGHDEHEKYREGRISPARLMARRFFIPRHFKRNIEKDEKKDHGDDDQTTTTQRRCERRGC